MGKNYAKKGVEAWWGFLAGAIVIIIVVVLFLIFYGQIKGGGESVIGDIMKKLGEWMK
ncbi:MAG: hypothetical protein QW625_01625 [Candidatus Nanoarchaeia archaeon]